MSRASKQLADQLGAVPLFERCTVRDRRAIARHIEVMEFGQGELVVVEGDVSDGFFLVLSGELEVVRDGATTATLTEGDHFGELALLDPAPRSASVRAVGDAEVGALNARMFRVLLRDMPEIAFELFGSLARLLREARNQPSHD